MNKPEMKPVGRKVYPEKLAELGFSPKEIAAAVAMEKAGLYDMEPSEDLVERTIQRCAAVLRPQEALADDVPVIRKPSRVLEAYAAAIRDLSPALLKLPEWDEVSRLQDLQQACLATIHFAQTRRDRPLVMLDNHNLIEPAWWSGDTGFRAIRNACQIANKAAIESGVPPSAVMVVLRPRVQDYSNSDFEAINDVLHNCTADLWWIPYDNAGKYQGLDCIVLGEERSLLLQAKAHSPVQALHAFRDSRDQQNASSLRGQLEDVARKGTQILVEGRLTAEAARQLALGSGVRRLMSRVIAEGSEVAACR